MTICRPNPTLTFPTQYGYELMFTRKISILIRFNFDTFVFPEMSKYGERYVILRFSSYLRHRNPSTIFLEPVTIEEIMKTIIALKDASAGWDSINKYMLINILDSILVPLTHILNCSIIQGVFPNKLKIAKIKPIYKADNKHKYSNYRPISLLTAISKIF